MPETPNYKCSPCPLAQICACTYIRPGWKRESHIIRQPKHHSRYVFHNFQSCWYGTVDTTAPTDGKIQGAVTARCSRQLCGPCDEDHILLWCVWVRPSAGPSQCDHSRPLLTRLNHCLLRQEGCPLYDIICCRCSVSASHLWLWQIEVCVFPDGQVSKSGHELKTSGLVEEAQPGKPLLPLWAPAFNTPSSYKNTDLFNLEL